MNASMNLLITDLTVSVGPTNIESLPVLVKQESNEKLDGYNG